MDCISKEILLSLFSAWSLILAAWFDAFGNIFLLYEEFFWYDDLGHFIGVFVITAFVLEIFSKLSMRKNWQLPFFHLGLYAFSLAMLIATIYEITEWIGDLYFGTYRITARLDSASDLWWGFVGGILALAIWRLQKKFKTSD